MFVGVVRMFTTLVFVLVSGITMIDTRIYDRTLEHHKKSAQRNPVAQFFSQTTLGCLDIHAY